MRRQNRFLLFSAFLTISLQAHAAANTQTPLEFLEDSLAADGPAVDREVKQKQFKSAESFRQMQSGDVVLYLESPNADKSSADDPFPMPEAWNRGLQGIGHAALVARDSKNHLYHLDSPYDNDCDTEFKGKRPYIVIRKNQRPENFGSEVDKLAAKFGEIGYDYDTGFKTEAMSWTPQQAQAMREKIETWKPDQTKPHIPDMYCSELPVTIFTMLGQPIKTGMKMGNVLDIGTRAQIISACAKKGSGCEKMSLKNLTLAEITARVPEKVSSQVASDISDKLIKSFASDYQDQVSDIKDHEKALREANKSKQSTEERQQTETDLNELDKQLSAASKTLKTLNGIKPELTDLLRMRLGLPACSINPADKYSLSSLSHKIVEDLAYYTFTNRTLIRPVDLLKDKSQFSIVGYYAGDQAATCDPDAE